MPEVLKIIIGVLVISILVYLAFSLYGLFTSKPEIEQARAIMTQIEGRVEELVNDGDKKDILITSPQDWFIHLFNSEEYQPLICERKNCLCMCPESDKEAIKRSDHCEDGICFTNEKQFIVTESTIISAQNIQGIHLHKDFLPFSLAVELEDNRVNVFIERAEIENIELFNNLLDSEYDFLDQGKKTIKDQILYWYNSGSAPAHRDKDAKNDLIQNIGTHFSKYDYAIYVYFVREGQWSIGQPLSTSSMLRISAGGDKKFSIKNVPHWPNLVVENSEGNDVIIIFQRRI